MRSHATWSITVCRWAGLHVRIHCFFLLFATFTLFLGWSASRDSETTEALTVAAVSLLILLGSGILHELGHYWIALRLGGDADEIVLGPLGGLSSMRPPVESNAECLMHLAGPLTNLLICLVCSGLLFLLPGDVNILHLLHPISPTGLLEGARWLIGLKLTFWINWILLIVNLLPAFPFDGGRALRAALSGFWPDASPRRAAALVSLVAKCASIAVVGVAIFLLVRQEVSKTLVPIWFALLLLAIFLYFSAKHEEERLDENEFDDEMFGYDFSQGYTSLERSADERQTRRENKGAVRRWFHEWKKSRLLRQRQVEAEEERRVDEILERLHEKGIDSLSSEERSLLTRVSQRYRQRHDG